MLEHQAGLFGSYTREKFHELREGNIVVEVLKQCCQRNTRPPEQPNAAEALGIPFHFRAVSPVHLASS
jgi:hypothetical protein